MVLLLTLLLFGSDVMAQQKVSRLPSESEKANQFRLYCGKEEYLKIPGASIEKALMAGLIYDWQPASGKKSVRRQKTLAVGDNSQLVCLKVSGVSGQTSQVLLIDLTPFPQLNVKLQFTSIDSEHFKTVVAVSDTIKGETIPALCDETWINLTDEGRSRVSPTQRLDQAPLCRQVLKSFHADAERVHAVESFLAILVQTAKEFRANKGQDMTIRYQTASDHMLRLNPILGVRSDQ
jgi:hypothetical protein